MNPRAARMTHDTPSPADNALIESVIRADLIAALDMVLAADAARPAAGYRNTALADLAAEINAHLAEHFDFDEHTRYVGQALALAEEAGEFTGAFRRWAGLARRTGTWAEMVAELADVVITAYVTADVLGIDLAAAITAKASIIMTRGWRDPRLPEPACIPQMPEGQWACTSCGAGYFGIPPESGHCVICAPEDGI